MSKLVPARDLDRLERLVRDALSRALACVEDARKIQALVTIRIDIDPTKGDDSAAKVTALLAR